MFQCILAVGAFALNNSSTLYTIGKMLYNYEETTQKFWYSVSNYEFFDILKLGAKLGVEIFSDWSVNYKSLPQAAFDAVLHQVGENLTDINTTTDSTLNISDIDLTGDSFNSEIVG